MDKAADCGEPSPSSVEEEVEQAGAQPEPGESPNPKKPTSDELRAAVAKEINARVDEAEKKGKQAGKKRG